MCGSELFWVIFSFKKGGWGQQVVSGLLNSTDTSREGKLHRSRAFPELKTDLSVHNETLNPVLHADGDTVTLMSRNKLKHSFLTHTLSH